MADGSIVIDTKIDDTGLNSQLSKLSKGVTGFGIGMGKTIAAGAAAAGTAIAGLGAIGLKYNADMENYTTNFKVMLGSQEAAVAKVDELKKLAAKTPFELGELADATQTLLAFGVESENITPTLTAIGDVALGNQEKFKGMALAFGQIQSTGRATAEDVNQLIERGFNPLLIISEKTGESMADLKERMSQGAVSADEIAEAFQIATSEGGQFYKGMEEASKTVTGMISTLKDNVNSLIGEVFMPISQTLLTTLIPAALGYIDQLTTAFQDKGVSGLIDAIGTILGDMLAEIAAAAPKFIDSAFQLLESFVQGLNDNVDKIGEGASAIIESLVNGILNLLPNILDLALNLIIALANGLVKALPELLQKVPEIMARLIETFGKDYPKFVKVALELIQALVAGLVQAIPVLLANLPKITGAILKVFGTLVAAMPKIGLNIVQGLWQGIKGAAKWIADKVGDFVDKIKKKFTGKEGFDTHSPSKFTEEIGKNLGEGLVIGMDKISDYVSKGTAKLTKASKDKLEEFVDRDLKRYVDAAKDRYREMATEIENISKKHETELGKVQDNIDSRIRQIMGFGGLFDLGKLDEPTQNILGNLQQNVITLEEFEKTLQSLVDKGLPTELLKQFQQLGVESLPNLRQIANLSEADTTRFVELWTTKNELAKRVAEAQYADDIKIINDTYRTELMTAYANFYADMNNEKIRIYDKSQELGSNTVKGIVKGINDNIYLATMAISKMVDDMIFEAQSGLEIHSPSRVFARMGKFTAQGLGNGFVDEMQKVKKQMQSALPLSFDGYNATASYNAYKNNAQTAQNGSNGTAKQPIVIQVGERIFGSAVVDLGGQEQNRIGKAVLV